jgi:hypothetical protein
MLYCRLCVLYCTAGPASVPYKDYCTLYCITGPAFCTVLQSCTLQYIILNSVLDKQVQNHAFYCGSGILYCPAGTASASYFSSCFCTLLPVLYSAPFRRSCILYRLKILHFIVLNLLHWKGHLSKPSWPIRTTCIADDVAVGAVGQSELTCIGDKVAVNTLGQSELTCIGVDVAVSTLSQSELTCIGVDVAVSTLSQSELTCIGVDVAVSTPGQSELTCIRNGIAVGVPGRPQLTYGTYIGDDVAEGVLGRLELTSIGDVVMTLQ